MSVQRRILLALQRLVFAVQRTPLGRLLVPVYRLVARATGAALTWRERDAAVYVRGGLGRGDFQPGLSDIDLAVVLSDEPAAPGRAAARIRRRWERLRRRLFLLEPLIDLPRIHERAELQALTESSAFTYGLHRGGPAVARAAYFGDRTSLDLLRTLERPGLYEATDDWFLLSGRDRRPREPARSPQERRIAAWLELVWTWRAAFPFVADPTMPRAASACVKLVAEPARIWLWLARNERAAGRADALRRALRCIPEEEAALGRALELQGALSGQPTPAFAELLPAAVRLSARVVALIADQIADAGATRVRLAGEATELVIPEDGQRAGAPAVLPLADWRAVASPELPDESFLLGPGDPRDPAVLAGTADRVTGPYPALRAEGLMILPAVPLRRTRLRAIKGALTDPVPFAVAAGEREAALPEVEGWSARDTARRAVCEHQAWLEDGSGPNEDGSPAGSGRHLGRLLTAARAALFLESVEGGEPELCLTVVETARQLGARSAAARSVAGDVLGGYREFVLQGAQPPARLVAAMRELVLGLPGYRAR